MNYEYREIKFRAWITREVEGCFYKKDTMQNWDIVIDDTNWFIKCRSLLAQQKGGAPYILMQYAGLKDENGKDIYEGDIVRIKVWRANEIGTGGRVDIKEKLYIYYIPPYPFQVCYNDDEAGFELYSEKECEENREGFFGFCDDNKLEVIGNIYENPEILTKSYE